MQLVAQTVLRTAAYESKTMKIMKLPAIPARHRPLAQRFDLGQAGMLAESTRKPIEGATKKGPHFCGPFRVRCPGRV
jgi:hypothetical protein